MTQRIRHKISTLPVRKKNTYYKDHSEGYGHCNDFVLSDKIEDWQIGKTRRFKTQSKPLF